MSSCKYVLSKLLPLSCNSQNRILRPFLKSFLTCHVTLYSWAVLYTIVARFKEGLDFPFLCSGCGSIVKTKKAIISYYSDDN